MQNKLDDSSVSQMLSKALWRIYRRPVRPIPRAQGSDFPWNEPGFARRVLQEHLDDVNGAASRPTSERLTQIDWLWSKMGLAAGAQVLDITCGPGLYAVELAARGANVTGVDINPVALSYARDLASSRDVADKCTFVESDVLQMVFPAATFEAALFLYGQLGVFTPEEAQTLLKLISRILKPGGTLCVELLDQRSVDKSDSTWWFTDEGGLWGDAPFLHLGERFWIEEEEVSIERYQILSLDTGELTEISVCDQTYATDTMTQMMAEAGFGDVRIHKGWDDLPLEDASEWIAYLAHRSL